MSQASIRPLLSRNAAAAVMAGMVLASAETYAEPLGYAGPVHRPRHVVEQILPDLGMTADGQDATEIASHLRRRIVDYPTREALYGRVSVGTKVVALPAKPHLGSGLTARGRSNSEARPVIANNNTVRAFALY